MLILKLSKSVKFRSQTISMWKNYYPLVFSEKSLESINVSLIHILLIPFNFCRRPHRLLNWIRNGLTLLLWQTFSRVKFIRIKE